MVLRRDESSKILGTWWRTDRAEIRLAGQAHLDPKGEIELALHGLFHENPIDAFKRPLDEVNQYQTVHGIDEHGQPVSILRCLDLAGKGPLWKGPWIGRVIGLYYVQGLHLEGIDSPASECVTLDFPLLGEWTGARPFTDFHERDGNPRHLIAHCRLFEPLAIDVPSPPLAIELSCGLNTRSDRGASLTAEVAYFISASSQSPQSVRQWLFWIQALQEFLSFVSGTDVDHRTATLGRGVSLWSPSFREMPQRSQHEMLIPLFLLKDQFAEVVTRWFALRSNVGTSIQLLLAASFGDQLPLPYRFGALAQAIDSFHRNMFDGGDGKTNLLRRVEELIDSLDATVRNAVFGAYPKFAVEFRRMRNDIAHGYSRQPLSEEYEEHMLYFRLGEILLTLSIVRELGIPQEAVAKRLGLRFWPYVKMRTATNSTTTRFFLQRGARQPSLRDQSSGE